MNVLLDITIIIIISVSYKKNNRYVRLKNKIFNLGI